MAEFMPGQYWGVKRGSPRGGGLLPGRVPAVHGRRRAPPDAAGHVELQQRVSQGRAGARDAQDAAGARSGSGPRSTATSPATPTATPPATTCGRRCWTRPGESLDWFWSQWIYAAGYPAFAVTAAYDSTARALTLTVRQTQVDTATADSTGPRFATPLVFRAPIDIRVGTAAGDVVAPRHHRPPRGDGAHRRIFRGRPPWSPSTTPTRS